MQQTETENTWATYTPQGPYGTQQYITAASQQQHAGYQNGQTAYGYGLPSGGHGTVGGSSQQGGVGLYGTGTGSAYAGQNKQQWGQGPLQQYNPTAIPGSLYVGQQTNRRDLPPAPPYDPRKYPPVPRLPPTFPNTHAAYLFANKHQPRLGVNYYPPLTGLRPIPVVRRVLTRLHPGHVVTYSTVPGVQYPPVYGKGTAPGTGASIAAGGQAVLDRVYQPNLVNPQLSNHYRYLTPKELERGPPDWVLPSERHTHQHPHGHPHTQHWQGSGQQHQPPQRHPAHGPYNDGYGRYDSGNGYNGYDIRNGHRDPYGREQPYGSDRQGDYGLDSETVRDDRSNRRDSSRYDDRYNDRFGLDNEGGVSPYGGRSSAHAPAGGSRGGSGSGAARGDGRYGLNGEAASPGGYNMNSNRGAGSNSGGYGLDLEAPRIGGGHTISALHGNHSGNGHGGSASQGFGLDGELGAADSRRAGASPLRGGGHGDAAAGGPRAANATIARLRGEPDFDALRGDPAGHNGNSSSSRSGSPQRSALKGQPAGDYSSDRPSSNSGARVIGGGVGGGFGLDDELTSSGRPRSPAPTLSTSHKDGASRYDEPLQTPGRAGSGGAYGLDSAARGGSGSGYGLGAESGSGTKAKTGSGSGSGFGLDADADRDVPRSNAGGARAGGGVGFGLGAESSPVAARTGSVSGAGGLKSGGGLASKGARYGLADDDF